MRSSRTFAEDTTSWPLRSRSVDGCPWRSTSWPGDLITWRGHAPACDISTQRNSALRVRHLQEGREADPAGLREQHELVAGRGRERAQARPSAPVPPLTNSRIRDGG